MLIDYGELIELSNKRIMNTKSTFVRSVDAAIDWSSRLIGIRGARGCGKTTLLLQHLKNCHMNQVLSGKALYASLDNLWFSGHTLMDFVESFAKSGGKLLCLDEVHRYPDWALCLKNIYDDYPELKVVFTGSSLLEILNARADLSRRAVIYKMQGLSFREYLTLKSGVDFPVLKFEDILKKHVEIAYSINERIHPLEYFQSYLRSGYYPYFIEGESTYHMKLEETVNLILDIELPLLRNVEIVYVQKIRKLLALIAESSPFTINTSKVAAAMELNRQTLLSYLRYLTESKLIMSLYRDARGVSPMQKPDKIYLDNPNLMYLFKGNRADSGNMRETFLLSQLSNSHLVEFSSVSDFLVDGKFTIECGGRNKTGEQLKGLDDSFVAADGIEFGSGTKIPLWLFGFLY